jgi:gliding motility-associated-like protein
MIRILSLLLLASLFLSTRAFTQSTLLGHFRFENCTLVDITGNSDMLSSNAPLECDCGLDGTAAVFDGSNQFLNLSQSSSGGIFTRASLSVSFFFRPTGATGQMVLVSKKESCLSNNGFSIKYNTATREIIAEFEESGNNRIVLRAFLDQDRCWHHIVVNRFAANHQLVINNQLRDTGRSAFTLNLTNDGPLLVGSGPCVGTTDVRFRGLINRLTFYSPELSLLEINGLFPDQDKLQNRDTTLFLGSGFPARPSVDCGISYSWFPTDGVSDPTVRNPILSPTETTSYIYTINYSGCIARDTLNVTVIDPRLLECENLPMPNAFTPNSDGLNETYFISNPFTYDELLSFEIFERNGGKVFSTSNSFEGWDGSFKGQLMPSGTYLYMIKFRCGDKNIQRKGSFVLIR